MRRQPEEAAKPSLVPADSRNGSAFCGESKASPIGAGSGGPMAHRPPPEERLLPNGNVCHFAGCGCDGGEIRAALKECVSNMRQQQQQQQHNVTNSCAAQCGCPVLFRGHCEHQALRKPLKSLLKRRDPNRPRRGCRVRFSDTLTVFSEEYPEAQLYVVRTAELTFAEVCSMYEPPPEYRDMLPFEPPDGYRDESGYLVPFRKEASVDADVVRVHPPPPPPASHGAARFQKASSTTQTIESAGQDKAVDENKKQLIQPSSIHVEVVENVQVYIQEAPEEPPYQPPEEPPREVPRAPSQIAEERKRELEEESQLESPVVDNVDTKQMEAESESIETDVEVKDEDDTCVDQTKETPEVSGSPPIIMDEDEDILLELKKQLECNGDLEADLSELLPPGHDKDMEGKELEAQDECEDAKVLIEEGHRRNKTDERQDDSDSSGDSQDTIILMTAEESKKNEEHIQESNRKYQGFRSRVLIVGDRSPSDTSSVSSSNSQDSDASIRSSETSSSPSSSTTEDRSESPSCTLRCTLEDLSEEDLYGGQPCSNSEIRKTIERTAMRRSLTRVTDVRKRLVSTPTLAKSPTSSNEVSSLVEKLRWLTSLEDENPPGEPSNGDAERKGSLGSYYGPSQEAFLQDAGRPLPSSAYTRAHPTFFQRNGLVGQQRPASFSTFSDARGSPTMVPVAARDYRMTRRVPGENHPQQNRIPPRPALPQQQQQQQQPQQQQQQRPLPHTPPQKPPHSNSPAQHDELERFVQQDMERTERIRKRYSLSEEEEDPSFGFARRPSVRGIRQRFGSTTELPKDVSGHPAINVPGSHLSWSHPVDISPLPSNHKTPQQVKVMLLPRVAEEDPHTAGADRRSYGSAGDIATLTRGRRLFPQTSTSSTVTPAPSNAKDERGVPEGASSSPKVTSDSVYHVKQTLTPAVTETPQGIVYYSLNV